LDLFLRPIYNPLIYSNAFQKIALITDRDERDIKTLENTMREELNQKNIKNRLWCENNYFDKFDKNNLYNFLLLNPFLHRVGKRY